MSTWSLSNHDRTFPTTNLDIELSFCLNKTHGRVVRTDGIYSKKFHKLSLNQCESTGTVSETLDASHQALNLSYHFTSIYAVIF